MNKQKDNSGTLDRNDVITFVNDSGNTYYKGYKVSHLKVFKDTLDFSKTFVATNEKDNSDKMNAGIFPLNEVNELLKINIGRIGKYENVRIKDFKSEHLLAVWYGELPFRLNVLGALIGRNMEKYSRLDWDDRCNKGVKIIFDTAMLKGEFFRQPAEIDQNLMLIDVARSIGEKHPRTDWGGFLKRCLKEGIKIDADRGRQISSAEADESFYILNMLAR